MDLHQLIEEPLGPFRLGGQQHQEPVVAVKKLARLQQVAAEQADECSVGSLP